MQRYHSNRGRLLVAPVAIALVLATLLTAGGLG